MRKSDKKDNVGITLIALVITIIVLLILAGITIAQLSNNGLFERTRIAKEKSKVAKEKENTVLGDYEAEIEKSARGTVTISEEEYNMLRYANTYSTNETRIGTWINGKPLYRKTVTGLKISSTAGTWQTSYTETNAEMLMIEKGYVTASFGIVELNYYNSQGVQYRINDNRIETYGSISDYANLDFFAIIKYTKKSDATP